MGKELVNLIGEYQLGNLIANGVPFLYIYVKTDGEELPEHPLLKGITVHSFEGLIQFVENKTKDLSYPIVLICRDGVKSFEAASNLIVAGYLNVFAVEGGVNELS